MGTVLEQTFVPFLPSASAADSIFAAISSGECSPQQLARQHNTTVEALVLWLESDEARNRLAVLNAGLALFTRSIALTHLPAASHLLARIIDECRKRFSGADTAHAAINDRHLCRLSYIASSLLYRLARTPDRAPAPRAPRATDIAPSDPGSSTAPSVIDDLVTAASAQAAISVPASLDATPVTDTTFSDPSPAVTVPLNNRTTESLREEIKQSIAQMADPDSCADLFARIDQFDRATLIDMLEGAEQYALNPDEPLSAPGPAP